MILFIFLFFFSCKTSSENSSSDNFELNESRPIDPQKEKKIFSSIKKIIIQSEGSLIKVLPHSQRDTVITPPQFAYGCFFSIKRSGKEVSLEVRSEINASLKSCEVLIQTNKELSYDLTLDKNSEALFDVDSEDLNLNIQGIFEHKKEIEKLTGQAEKAQIKIAKVEEGSFTQIEGISQFNFRHLEKPFTLNLQKGKTYIDIDSQMIIDPKRKKLPVVEKKGFFKKKEIVPLLEIKNNKGQVLLIQNTGKSS